MTTCLKSVVKNSSTTKSAENTESKDEDHPTYGPNPKIQKPLPLATCMFFPSWRLNPLHPRSPIEAAKSSFDSDNGIDILLKWDLNMIRRKAKSIRASTASISTAPSFCGTMRGALCFLLDPPRNPARPSLRNSVGYSGPRFTRCEGMSPASYQ